MNLEKWFWKRYEKEFWNEYAEVYPWLGGLIPYQELMTAVMEPLVRLPHGATVVDVGCGPGMLMNELRKVRPDLKLIGIDRSPIMLEHAHRHLGDDARFVQGDLNTHALDSLLASASVSQVDAVVSTNVYYALADPHAFLIAVRRVLCSGGRFVLVNPCMPDQMMVWRAHARALFTERNLHDIARTIQYLPWYLVIFGMNVLIARRARRARFHFVSLDELVRRVRDAKFTCEAFSDAFYGATDCFISSVAS